MRDGGEEDRVTGEKKNREVFVRKNIQITSGDKDKDREKTNGSVSEEQTSYIRIKDKEIHVKGRQKEKRQTDKSLEVRTYNLHKETERDTRGGRQKVQPKERKTDRKNNRKTK